VTIDGVKVNYDVNSQSFDFIMNSINTAVQAVDPGFLATVAPGTDTVVFRSSDKPITLGSAGDNGNILQVFKLDQAQLVNTASSGLVTAVGGVGGVNQALVFNSQNAFAATTDANYKTPVTSGTFTINGVTISVDNAKDALSDVLKRINSSAAGVTAALNQETGQITLTNNGTGPQSIVVGSGSDTSNFLTASGLTTASGATSTIGAQASITVQAPGGATSTTYSNSNTVTTAINGVSLNLLQGTATPFTVTVSPDSTGLVNGINGFISAYNAAINEINIATMAPTVLKQQAGTSQPSQAVGGGVLYGNADVQSIKDALTNIVAGFVANQTTGYNSFQSIGLQISSSFSVLQANDPSAQGGAVSTQTLGGTDGTLQALDLTKFNAAMAANPSQVQALFTSSTGIIGSLGAYLTGVTGQPTTLTSGLVGTIPSISLMQGFENSNSDQISSLQKQVQLITDQANQYADSLRQQFSASEQQIAQYQSLQSQLAGFFKNG
jgi:flagellar capping protein FliD